MYEQHFGLSGHPFAMTPNPDFYFDSPGHRRAFAYLQHAVLEGESFIVMTGDTGAGKTTLLHKLLRNLDSQTIVSGLVPGTPLDARGALLAVMTALRAPVDGKALDELRAGLRAFVGMLGANGRRALVVVDEAQNLLPDAIEEVTALARLRPGRGLPLQVLLAGQPELRTQVQHTSAHAAREPVFLFCDIGLLGRDDTRSYIEHRLRHVDWHGTPSFTDDAYEAIFRATGGVPRCINRLCDRLLMTAFIEELDSIGAELVAQTDTALRAELGGGFALPIDAPTDVQPAPPPLASPPSHPSGPARRETIPTLFAALDDNPRAGDLARAPPPDMRADKREFGAATVRPRRAPQYAIGAAVLALLLAVGWWVYHRESIAPLAAAPRAASAPVTGNVTGNAQAARDAVRDLTERAPGAVGLPASTPAAAAPVIAPATPPPPVALPAPQPEVAPAVEPPIVTAAPVARPKRPRGPARFDATDAASARGGERAASGDRPPEPAPVLGPCTAAVAALGLCTPSRTNNNP
jgi:type II secretory pathway predicted ATPase ExeA